MLVGVPKEGHFGKIDKSCHGLIPLPAVERYGFLWVHPDPDGTIDVDTLLGGLAEEFDSWGWGSLVNIGYDAYDMRLHWKLAMDTFGETYHFNTLHRDTLALNFYGNVQCYDVFGRNHRMILCKRDIDGLRGQPEANWDITEAGLPVYYLFPNIQLNVFNFGIRNLSRCSWSRFVHQPVETAGNESFPPLPDSWLGGAVGEVAGV